MIRYELWGEGDTFSVVQVPSEEQEAALRIHRERRRLVNERTAHRARIKSLCILHGIEITNAGGNTLFANMYAAYDALDEVMKDRIEGLRVVHDHDYILSLSPELQKKKDRGTYDELPPVTHPLVQVHPVTQRRSLFLSPHTMARVEGLEEGEGRALLDELIAHATEQEFVYRHVWAKDDVIMWDNRCTMHSVEPYDNVNIRRIMHRVTLVGENKPIPA